MYRVVFAKRTDRERTLLKAAGLEENAKKLLNILVENPFQTPPPYEKLVGSLQGYYSRRINVRHRLVYSVDKDASIVVVRSMWTHYE